MIALSTTSIMQLNFYYDCFISSLYNSLILYPSESSSYFFVHSKLSCRYQYWWWFSCWVVSDSWNHIGYHLPGPSVHGILQARILEWIAISFFSGSSRPRNQTQVFCTAGRFFTDWATGEAFQYRYAAAAAKSLQSCPTLCDPMDGSPQGSPVPGILQARTLEWVAISFSNAWKWKVKVKLLSLVRLLATPWTAAHQVLCPRDFPGKSTGVGCHCLLRHTSL